LVTSDPKRQDGARAKRTEDYHADDVYLEWPIRSADANVSCIGLNWIERRPLTEIGIAFKDAAPAATGSLAQGWVGQTVFQGEWKPLSGSIEADGHVWRLKLDGKSTFQKIRWILPQSARAMGIDHLTASVLCPTATTELVVETEPGKSAPATIGIYNGELVTRAGSLLTVRYTQGRRSNADATLLRFMMPDGRGFSVAVDDVLKRAPILVRDYGVFIAPAASHVTLADYQKQIAGRQTVLQQVEAASEQTLSQAMAKLHHAVQDTAPLLISLSCDNHKVVVDRSGTFGIVIDSLKPDSTYLSPPKNVIPINVKFGNGDTANLSRHLAGGWLPAPEVRVSNEGAQYQERTMVIADQSGPLAIADFNLQAKDKPATLTLSFPDLTARQIPQGVAMESKEHLFALLETKDAEIKVSPHEVQLTASNGSARLSIPFWNTSAEKLAGTHADPTAELRKYWESVLSDGMQISLPDALLTNVIRASQVNCLMAARTEPGTDHVEPWIASVSYGPLESESNSIIRGMDLMGHADFTRHCLDYFISKYAPSGLLTTGYTLMGTGWHLQTLGQHYSLWHDADWLKGVAAKVETACRWIDAQRRKSLEGPDGIKEEAQCGLAPPGVMADWGNYGLYFCSNGYYCAGLRDAGQALADIGTPGAGALVKASQDYAEAIRRAYRMTQDLTPVYPLRDGTWVPGYPSQVGTPGPTNNFFPGEDGNRSWCYDIELGAHQLVPQGILDAKSHDTDWMLNHLEDVQFLANGWFDFPAAGNEADPFDFGGFAKVQPYYCRNAEIYAMRNDVKPFIRSYFNTLPTLLNTEVLTIEEHFHRIGAWNKTHETGYFLSQTRFMLVMEHGDELWLAPLVASNWFKDGMEIDVQNAPTAFGPVSYHIKSSATDSTVEAKVTPPTRAAPKALVIRLCDPAGRPIKSVTVNGEPSQAFDPVTGTVTVAHPKGPLTIRAKFE
jgi:hypothetical protein